MFKNFNIIEQKVLAVNTKCVRAHITNVLIFLNTQIIYDKFAYVEFPNSTKWHDRK